MPITKRPSNGELEELLQEYLKRFPVEKIDNLIIDDFVYNGNDNNLSYWLEMRTDTLGGIGGGSAYKFGVFKLDPEKTYSEKTPKGATKDNDFGWYKSYGETPQNAYENILKNIREIISAVKKGDYKTIDANPYSTAIKLKIAFLYSEKRLMNIFKEKALIYLCKSNGIDVNKQNKKQLCYLNSLLVEKIDKSKFWEESDRLWHEWIVYDNKTNFENWLKKRKIPSDLIEKYVFVLENNADYISDFNYPYSNLFSYDKKLFLEIEKFIRSDNLLKVADQKNGDGVFGVALTKYKDFLKKQKDNDDIEEDKESEKEMEDVPEIIEPIKIPLNQILYGPPGTGKTYISKEKAVEICDFDFFKELDDSDEEKYRKQIINKYEELLSKRRIFFTTFHQSMGYEDFIEGIKPITKDEDGVELDSMKYKVIPGIFKKICEEARKSTEVKGCDNFEEAWQNLIEYLEEHESVDITTLNGKATFTLNLNATGTGLSTIEDNPKFFSKEQINRIYKGEKGVPAGGHDNYRKAVVENFMKKQKEIGLKNYVAPEITEKKLPYLLIIDEINRGNIPQIFGELITLIEESKRSGANDEIVVTLPYSGERFSVPSNLYVLGTMNTADRSIEALDTALRRRFEFIPMLPDSSKLDAINDENGKLINLTEMLDTMNSRMEYLLDRDHTIGHAYFINVKNSSDLISVFNNKIIPQLQEYFYSDWKKIQLILGESFIEIDETKSFKDIFGESFEEYLDSEKIIYKIREPEFWDFNLPLKIKKESN